MATHAMDWVPDDSALTPQQKERGFSGYKCNVCGKQIAVPPGGMPQYGDH